MPVVSVSSKLTTIITLSSFRYNPYHYYCALGCWHLHTRGVRLFLIILSSTSAVNTGLPQGSVRICSLYALHCYQMPSVCHHQSTYVTQLYILASEDDVFVEVFCLDQSCVIIVHKWTFNYRAMAVAQSNEI